MMTTFHDVMVRVGHGEVRVARSTNRDYALYQARELQRRHKGVRVRSSQARVLPASVPADRVGLFVRNGKVVR